MMFEVQDLAVASPATVSRCGMVYLEPSILGLMPFVECWLKRLPAIIKPYEEQFKRLFDKFLDVSKATGTPSQRVVAEGCHPNGHVGLGLVSQQNSIHFVRDMVKEVIASTNSNLTVSLLKLLDCFFRPFLPREVQHTGWGWRPLCSCHLFLLGLQSLPSLLEVLNHDPPPPPQCVAGKQKTSHLVICPLSLTLFPLFPGPKEDTL